MNDDTQHTGSALEPTSGGGFSRRQLMKTGAWAAPVVVLAAAVPAAAASTRTLTIVSITAPTPTSGIGTIFEQAWFYKVAVRVKNNSGSPVSVTVTLTENNIWASLANPASVTLTLNPGQELPFETFGNFIWAKNLGNNTMTFGATAAATSFPTATKSATITRGAAINIV